jgi:predicted permease
LNADPSVIGQTVTVYQTVFTIIGVLEPAFDGLDRPVDLWLPLSAMPATNLVTPVGLESPASASCCISMVARLASSIEKDRAQQELQLLHERFAASTKRKSGRVSVFGTAYADMPLQNDLAALPLVVVALSLVLVLASANVGNLQLARGMARRREIATRMAIGAGRFRIVRQLVLEGLVLAAVAGAILLLVAAIVPSAYLWATESVPGAGRDRFFPDPQVMAVTAAICTLACLIFALAPALRNTRRTMPLGAMDRGSTHRARLHLRGGFMAVQIAVCTVLLIGAGLLTRAIAQALTFDPGFKVEGVQRVSVSLPSEIPAGPFDRQLIAALERDVPVPVAVGSPGPFTDFPFTMGIALPGEEPNASRQVARRSVSHRYFEVLEISMVHGKMFESGAKDEIVVNETFARAFFRGKDPVGHTVRHIDSKGAVAGTMTIVGVVRDAYLSGLERIEPIVFRPTTSGTLVAVGGAATLEQIRATAHALNQTASVRSWPLSDDVRDYLRESRYGAVLAWSIGLLGLLLASVGVLGVFAYAVEERRREIGIRLALGAARSHIIRMLVSTSGRSMLVGLAAGLLLSLACGPLLQSYLFGLHPLDPIAYVGVLGLLGVTAILATFVPARRACRVDPAVTLRDE